MQADVRGALLNTDFQHILWPDWEIVGLIGQGNYGTVYEIRRDMYGLVETAALKVISIPQKTSDIAEMKGDGSVYLLPVTDW
jgi:hypothetical protein